MALVIGDEQASNGMGQSIYVEMDRVLSPPIIDAIDDPAVAQATLEDARKGWRKLAYTIANGVISHLTANLEIFGVQTRGDVNVAVSGHTGSGQPGNHSHSAGTLVGEQENVVFIQSNDGTGRIR